MPRLLLVCLLVAGCGTSAEFDFPDTTTSRGPYPTLLPLAEVLTPPEERQPEFQPGSLAARAAELRRRAEMMR